MPYGKSPNTMSPYKIGHLDSPAEFINPAIAKAVGGAVIKAGKKVKKGLKKVAKKVKHDMTGGFEHARKRRQMRGGAVAQMKSPMEAGHSPVENHHYGKRKGESVKQEKYNLMHDNPVAKDASGGRDVSWMSKHSKSGGSPLGKHCM